MVSQAARMIHAIAVAPEPPTARELALEGGFDLSYTRSVLRECYRENLILRRPRVGESGPAGRNPYEYVLAVEEAQTPQETVYSPENERAAQSD